MSLGSTSRLVPPIGLTRRISSLSPMSQVTRPNILHLDCRQRDGTVVVTPADQDRFALTVEEAVKACRAYEQASAFRHQFQILLRMLADWIGQHRDQVAEAYVTVRDAGLLFLVVKKVPQYDDALEDQLTELDLAVAQDPNLDLIRLSVLAVPPASQEAIDSFLASGFTLQYAHAQ